APGFVLERVHLLLHEVRAFVRGPPEEVGVLEAGRLDPAISVERAQPLHLPGDRLPERLLGREDVVRAARRLQARRLRTAHALSSARNGLRSSSVPSVVCGPWPG